MRTPVYPIHSCEESVSKPIIEEDTSRLVVAQKAAEQVIQKENSEFIDAKAAAFWLGVPLRSFHQYVQKGFLPSYKLGRHRLFRKKELLAALSINRTASCDEVLF